MVHTFNSSIGVEAKNIFKVWMVILLNDSHHSVVDLMVREGGAYANGCPLPTRETNGGILFSLSHLEIWISWTESQTITPLLLQMLFKFGNSRSPNSLKLGRWNLINASLPFSSTSGVAAPNISTNSSHSCTQISSRFWRFGSNQRGSNVFILEHLYTPICLRWKKVADGANCDVVADQFLHLS
ncbi:hypothetical protein V6Z11_A04G044100 [Gossypium hirsutum]